MAVPPRLFFGGVVRGESAVRRESQVGSAVRFEVTVSLGGFGGGFQPCPPTPPLPFTPHPMQVSNRGQSLKTLGSAFLTLQWPHEISNGKWLLYPLQLELAAAPGPRASCSPAANPLQLALVRRGGGVGWWAGGGCPLSMPVLCPPGAARGH